MTRPRQTMLRRLLAALDLRLASDVEADRRRAAERLASVEARAERESARLRSRLDAARQRLTAREAHIEKLQIDIRDTREQVGHSRAQLRQCLDDRARDRVAARRLRARPPISREQLLRTVPIQLDAVRATAPQHRDAEQRFAAASPDYTAARDAWVAGTRPEGSHRATIGGLSFTVPPDGGGAGSLSQRIRSGRLPLDDLARIRQFVVGGTMLDIGGNIGTTCIPRAVLGDFALVYAAEPDLLNYQCLVGNVVDNGLQGRVLPDRLAISSSNGTARLRHSSHIGGHALLADGRAVKADDRVDVVAALTLDTWLERMAVPVDTVTFVKVDTQGWDPHVLAGAPALLGRRHAVWQVEVSPPMMQQAGYSVADFIALVRAHFSHVVEIDPLARAVPRSADALDEVLGTLSDRRRFTNLLLLNLAP